ncbi:hypothetical protein V8C34DRAFT_298427 [Trichoderma compactum]
MPDGIECRPHHHIYKQNMDNSRKISGNTLGDNVTLNRGKFNIAVNAASSDDKRKSLRNIGKTDPTYDKKRIQTLKGLEPPSGVLVPARLVSSKTKPQHRSCYG